MGNRETAFDLAAAGFAIFPCRERKTAPDQDNRKQPYPGVMWRSQSTADADRLRRWWDSWPDAIPGIDLAKTEFIVIDCDRPKRPGEADGVAWFDALCEDHGLSVDTIPTTVTPSGGWHLWFRQRPDRLLGNGRGALPKKSECGVDVRGAGGFVIGPGAVFEDDGQFYELRNGPIDAAPPIPDWLFEILNGSGAEEAAGGDIGAVAISTPAAIPPAPAASLGLNIDVYASRGFDAEIAAVESCPSGGRNNQLNESAFKIGRMVGAGWIDETVAFNRLLAACDMNGLAKDDGRKQCVKTIASGLRKGIQQPREAPAPKHGDPAHGQMIAEGLLRGAQAAAEPIPEPEDNDEPDVSPRLPDDLTQVPGLLGRLVDWLTDTASRPSRTLNLGVALCTLGALFGRRYASPTNLRTNVYLVTLAASGFGKSHPMMATRRLLFDAMLKEFVGGERIKSDAGLRSRLEGWASIVYMLDEIDGHIKPWINRNAKPHHANIRDLILSLFSSAGVTYVGDDYGAGPTAEIHNPNLCIYGTTTHARFWRAFEGGTIEDGFLPRFILLDAGTARPRSIEPALSLDPPAILVEMLRRASGMEGRGNMVAMRYAGNHRPEPFVMAWGDGAKALWHDAVADLDDEQDRVEPSEQPVIARIAEHAQKLAMIRAIGCNHIKPSIGVEDLEWGFAVARASAAMMLHSASDMIADTPQQADYLKVRRIITGGKKRGRTRAEIVRFLHGSIERRKLDEILALLCESGEVEIVPMTPQRGPTRQAYVRVQ